MTAILDARPYLPYFPDAKIIAPPDLPDDEWLQLRRSGLGGSEILTLLGLNPNAGEMHVWLDKMGRLEKSTNVRLARAARRGKRLEGLVREICAEETGHLITGPPGTLAHIGEPWMRANLDGMVFDPNPAVLECKTRTWRSAKSEDWNGVDPPDGPTVQACWYLKVTGWQRAYIAGLIDDDFVLFVVERDEEFLTHLTTVARRFWFEHVVTGRPPKPDGLPATAELLNHLWDVKPGTVKIFDPDEVVPLLDERRGLKKQIKVLEKQATEVENKLKVMLGDAEEAVDFTGQRLYGWKRNGNFPAARFREELPALAEHYTHMVPAIDIDRIKAEDPNLYATQRARVFRDGNPT